MKRIFITCLSVAILGLVSCKNETKDSEKEEDVKQEIEQTETKKAQALTAKEVTLRLDSKSNSNATGKVQFTETGGNVKMVAEISGLEPGTHAIHIHEEADCSAADATSSGGHWNPTFEDHGKWGDADGYHKGDIGNFEADSDGNGSITMTTNEWCIGCDDDTKNIIGKAIIVHKGADDFTSQPSGAAGARVSCGGIIQ
ncbi:superoxide dismutase family protein [Marinirhabdus gelatinilytica]|uniref:Cu-Zn family superoxide dismutase n=1 Tax=Marinirhabdus gelatinilytica TaxID=1703343 RepID=A0A370QFF7_9FLAO|nr:superoxide dismutase family protein [Marinirhabdus gelatinilytica]RDK87106.1 Cu-Zn family superoxide dismutase [Marinirhabdus gelatinilytica]